VTRLDRPSFEVKRRRIIAKCIICSSPELEMRVAYVHICCSKVHRVRNECCVVVIEARINKWVRSEWVWYMLRSDRRCSVLSKIHKHIKQGSISIGFGWDRGQQKNGRHAPRSLSWSRGPTSSNEYSVEGFSKIAKARRLTCI
jgi:hypothetical protein